MLFDKLLTKLAPFECLGCSAEGSLLCADCSLLLTAIPSRCYRCHRLTDGFKTCKTCRNHTLLYSLLPGTAYRQLAKDLVWKLKFEAAQAAAHEMAKTITRLLTVSDAPLLVPVPTTTARVRERGYDQAVLLAKALAAETKLPYATVLRRHGQQHQVGAGRSQRLTQLQSAFVCSRPKLVKQAHIVLVDDVLTTGATLETAAAVLKTAGAARISGIVFAQA